MPSTFFMHRLANFVDSYFIYRFCSLNYFVELMDFSLSKGKLLMSLEKHFRVNFWQASPNNQSLVIFYLFLNIMNRMNRI